MIVLSAVVSILSVNVFAATVQDVPTVLMADVSVAFETDFSAAALAESPLWLIFRLSSTSIGSSKISCCWSMTVDGKNSSSVKIFEFKGNKPVRLNDERMFSIVKDFARLYQVVPRHNKLWLFLQDWTSANHYKLNCKIFWKLQIHQHLVAATCGCSEAVTWPVTNHGL